MNRSPVAILVALIAAATLYSSTAQAGLRIGFGFGGGGPLLGLGGHGGGFHRHHERKTYVVRRAPKKKVHVAKEKPRAPKVAKQETRKVTKAATKVAKAENKKIVKQDVAKAEAPKPETRKVARAAPKASKKSDLAAAPLPETLAETENSSIASAAPVIAEKAALKDVDSTSTQTPKTEKTAGKLDCKKFFPTVGMTLSVPCE